MKPSGHCMQLGQRCVHVIYQGRFNLILGIFYELGTAVESIKN